MDKNFISEDKKSINLPVPLGSPLYTYVLKCCDACVMQKSAFEKNVGHALRCAISPCHTRLQRIKKYEFTLSGIPVVLKEWGKSIFATEQEALDAANKITKENREKIKSLGIILDKDGYCPQIQYFRVELSAVIGNEKVKTTYRDEICIRGFREPTIEEATEFCKEDIVAPQKIFRISKISYLTAHNEFNMEDEDKFPIFGLEEVLGDV